MMTTFRLAVLLSATLPLSGCIALAAVPVVAAGGLLGERALNPRPHANGASAVEAGLVPPTTVPPSWTQAAIAIAPAPSSDQALAAAPATPTTDAPANNAIVGTATASTTTAIAITPGAVGIDPADAIPDGASPYAPLVDFALSREAARIGGRALPSLVLAAGTNILSPDYIACGDRPPAVLISFDDGLGRSHSASNITAERRRVATLAADLARLRAARFTIVWLSDVPFDQDQMVYARLLALGLDPAGHDPLYSRLLPGDGRMGRQQEVAARFCVHALAGDRKSAIFDGYDYLNAPELAAALEPNWNAGWFLLPTPSQMADGGAPAANALPTP